mmetsp:Transcript_12653/g.37050  ORF Transcript_12653/g.37050 Transcript_12653/m.37050 type:complete len:260 (+) Transcript_12653:263-1042(+)
MSAADFLERFDPALHARRRARLSSSPQRQLQDNGRVAQNLDGAETCASPPPASPRRMVRHGGRGAHVGARRVYVCRRTGERIEQHEPRLVPAGCARSRLLAQHAALPGRGEDVGGPGRDAPQSPRRTAPPVLGRPSLLNLETNLRARAASTVTRGSAANAACRARSATQQSAHATGSSSGGASPASGRSTGVWARFRSCCACEARRSRSAFCEKSVPPRSTGSSWRSCCCCTLTTTTVSCCTFNLSRPRRPPSGAARRS